MMPYILRILHCSGTPQDVPTIARKLREFNITEQETNDELETSIKESLERAMSMGLVRKNAGTNTYKLANKWFLPESQSFQRELYEVVQNMPEALNDSLDSSSEEFATTSDMLSGCMGPGMRQRRSPAQIRAIEIYKRMREQREREEREAAARARKRRNSRSQSRSRSRTRRSSSNRTRSRSKRNRSSTRSRSRSTRSARSSSRSRRH
uniref:Uncharacterized protein n=1 Tax=Anopheles funestus TaxID=62324 RepID=A0A182RPR2_ANOFN